MPPRKSKTPRQTISHSDISGVARQTNGNIQSYQERPKTNWPMIDSRTFEGFTVTYDKHMSPDKRKQKRGKKRKFKEHREDPEDENISIQENPFKGTSIPDTCFSVHPANMWRDTSWYTGFTIEDHTFCVEDYVYVKADEKENLAPDAPIKEWVAKLLEVRAGDEQHVYLRVYWMYRPEDLPGGRQPYHGQNEVIASNDIQIINAMSVQAKANVKRWVEQDENGILDSDQLFWRQTLHVSGKKRVLSKLPLHCVDKMPCNPDKLLIRCSHCRKWLHGACLERAVVRDAYNTHNVPFPGDNKCQEAEMSTSTSNYTDLETPSKGRRTSAGAGSLNGTNCKPTPQRSNSKQGRPKKEKGLIAKVAEAVGLAKPPSGLLFSAHVVTQDSKTKLEVTDLRLDRGSKRWEVPLKCLLCKEDVEERDTKFESESERRVSDTEVKKEDAETGEVPMTQTPNGIMNGEDNDARV
ncbi:hypothetical protein K469DRAFT_38699 [Zopfia rhizophila CBS 207.26]|uniref:BAH domain-containing protein n=1 Tax=Zopfia rhizophila CBS 207.26 TaxID=1314779 RepID=A0A6A6DEL0_9PEZI|nr:hypothetical protein K469DRAFT_38699 [Zopfia rhizophila CBS 207.26]